MTAAISHLLRRAGYPPLPRIAFGTGTLTLKPDYFGKVAEEGSAKETIEAILESPFPFIDTARNYGDGLAEQWIGDVLRSHGGLPDGALLSTKLDRDPETGAFDASRARKSLEQSLTALGLTRLPILYLHDPEHARSMDEVAHVDGPLRELSRYKEEGLVSAIGLAAGAIAPMRKLLGLWDFDAVMTHSRYTLLNRSAEPLIADAHSRGIAVSNAAVMASGILAVGSKGRAHYVYREAPSYIIERVAALESLCAEYAVELPALALHFSLRDPRLSCTVVGVSRPGRISHTVKLASTVIPDEMWKRVSELPFEESDPESGRQV